MSDELKRVELEANMKDVISLLPMYADAVWAYHKALLQSGFNEQQALSIVLAHGWMPPVPGSGSGDKE